MRIAPAIRAAAVLCALAAGAASAGLSVDSAVLPAEAKALRAESFRAPNAFTALIRLEAPDPARIAGMKAANARAHAKRLDVGIGRELAGAHAQATPARWTSAPGGSVARWQLTSQEALSLRVALHAEQWPGEAELRFAGTARPDIVYGPFAGSAAAAAGLAYWSPVLEGDTAIVEVFVPAHVAPFDVSVARLSHWFVSFADPKAELAAKAAEPCQVNLICRSAGDAALATAGRSVARIAFSTDTGGSSLCTGTLLNTATSSFVPYMATAGHCINDPAEAASVTTRWYYETAACTGTALNPADTQVGGGAVLLYANEVEDFALIRLNANAPGGAVFSGWDATRLEPGMPMTGIHHPNGDVKKVSLGTASGVEASVVADGNGFRIKWAAAATGFTEPGSSGSGIFSGDAALGYRFRGTLQGGPLATCASPVSELYDDYSRFDLAFPFVAQYLNPSAAPALGPNALSDPGFEGGGASWTQAATSGEPIVVNDAATARTGSWYAWLGGFDSASDTLHQALAIPAGAARLQFWYRIATSETLATAFDRLVITVNDAASGAILRQLGTLSNLDRTSGWVQSPVYDLSAFGNRTVRLQLRATTDTSLPTSFRIDDLTLNGTSVTTAGNHTALYYIASESGWGINVNHQGDTAFATLFTYAPTGEPMWLVMPAGTRQGGAATFMGSLYRTTGPPFNANPFTPIGPGNITEVGRMTLDFNGAPLLGYTMGTSYVPKAVAKQVFGAAAASCTGTSGSRAAATNYQDLWWDPDESGWGINLTHQGDTIFATLFTYSATGQGLWLVMDAGRRQGDGSYLGTLYRTTGPAFDAVPFPPIGPGNVAAVGTMRLRFANGETGTLEYTVDGAPVTKQIQRQVFSSPAPLCSG